jgi:hypothetical protein
MTGRVGDYEYDEYEQVDYYNVPYSTEYALAIDLQVELK